SSGAPSTSSFDFINLFFKVLNYWYLFVLCIALALVLAWVINKSWTPTYRTASTILIEDSRANLRNDFTSGYGASGGNKNLVNQMIIYNSYDMISETIDKLGVTNEIYIKHRFKNTILYKNAPIDIETNYAQSLAYGREFRIVGIDDNTYKISFEGDEQVTAFSMEGIYGEDVQHGLFFINVHKTDLFANPIYDLHFKFLSKGGLIGSYGGRLSTRVVGENSSVIEVSLTGKVAQRDVDFLYLLNKQFFDQNLARKNDIADRATSFIERQIAIIRDSITVSEDKLNTFQRSSGLYSSDISSTRMKELESLDDVSRGLKLRSNYIDLLSNNLQSGKTELLSDPSAFAITASALSSLVAQYNQLVIDTKAQAENSPLYKINQKALEELRTQLWANIDNMRTTISMEESENDQRKNKARSEIANLPQQERRLMGYERDFKINDTYYVYLLQRRTESQIQKASNTPDNMVIDNPRVVGTTNMGEKSNNYLLFGLIGFLIPVVFVACKEFLFKFSVQSRDEVEAITQAPLLGTIEKSKKKEDLAVKNHPRSSFAEGFRNLRSRMEYVAQKESPISMLVTSTEPRDGKTFIAMNLASIYELAKRKIIVVDFDLRRPALSKTLGVDNKNGLTSYLIGQSTVDDIIIQDESVGFDLIPAGVTPPNPSELVRSHKTKELLDELYKRYEFVILDCSPVGLVSDAHYLARLVDVVLYVVRNEKTNKNFLKYTIKELKEDGVNNITVIYNDVNIKHNYYGNRRYYGKSSYYLRHGNYYHND
ncbi:polysaccharide biosynthesis tyrosine autokinase, partial [Bacteroidales bacterium OttesenSCG-928-L03]|nr:polysaccharide biosynthesis tyrosine autokinase [Bacteroidales bacterium OttesenSCG-928-L03]